MSTKGLLLAVGVSAIFLTPLSVDSTAYASERRPPTKQELELYGAEKALFHYLLDDYDKSVRPVKNYNDTVIVTIGVKLNQIMELHEKFQILTTIVAVDQEWHDQFLQWSPDDFGGLTSTYLPCSRVWLPDVVLYNGVNSIRELQFMQAHVTIDHNGHVVWFPLVKLESGCPLDIRFYPFDEQLCFLKFGSWSYSMREVDVIAGVTGIEKQDYVDNGEFELKNLFAVRVENVYDCCPVPIPTLNIGLHFRRRPMFSVFTLAVPCTMLSLMTAMAFVLPPDNGGKIEVQLSVMLSLAVFMLMIGENLPPTPDAVPLLGVHIVVQMGVTALSFVCSIIVLRVVRMDYKEMPRTLRMVGHRIAKWLRVDYDGGDKKKTLPSEDVWIPMAHNGSNLHKQTPGLRLQRTADIRRFEDDLRKLCPAPNGTARKDSNHAEANPVLRNEGGKSDKLTHYVKIIVDHMEEQDARDRRRNDWKMLGLVMDRFLLLILLFVDTCTTLYMYAVAPSLPIPKA